MTIVKVDIYEYCNRKTTIISFKLIYYICALVANPQLLSSQILFFFCLLTSLHTAEEVEYYTLSLHVYLFVPIIYLCFYPFVNCLSHILCNFQYYKVSHKTHLITISKYLVYTVLFASITCMKKSNGCVKIYGCM